MKQPLTIARIQTAKVPAGVAETEAVGRHGQRALPALSLPVAVAAGSIAIAPTAAGARPRSAPSSSAPIRRCRSTLPATQPGPTPGRSPQGKIRRSVRRESPARETAALGTLLAVGGPYERQPARRGTSSRPHRCCRGCAAGSTGSSTSTSPS